MEGNALLLLVFSCLLDTLQQVIKPPFILHCLLQTDHLVPELVVVERLDLEPRVETGTAQGCSPVRGFRFPDVMRNVLSENSST